MRMRIMMNLNIKKVIFSVLLGLGVSGSFMLSGCSRGTQSSDVKASGNPVGGFKGYLATQKVLSTRLFSGATDQFNFLPYLGYERSLLELMGSFQTQGSTATFINGTPNAMNMLLWQIVFSGLSSDIASSCGRSSVEINHSAIVNYNPTFASHLGALCTWPDSNSKNEANLLNFWLSVQAFDAPREEYESWRDFFLKPDSPYAQATSKEAIKAMLMTMLMSPDFLLEH